MHNAKTARGTAARLAGLVAGALLALQAGAGLADTGDEQSAAAVGENTRFGVYDPAGAFGAPSKLSIEHIYLPLVGVDLGSLRQAGSYAAVRHRELLVTVEPWSWDGRWTLANEAASAAIVGGKYDQDIVALCKTIGDLPTPAILRWGHEMEAKTSRYAWTQLPPGDYIAGYRHFVSLCRPYAPTAKFMWSPLGESDLVRFYPGDDVVDVVGFSVFALQRYERDRHGVDRNIDDIARERYDLVVNYRKPVFIAELGCSGDADYVATCLRQMAALGGELPALAAIVYFNDVEPSIWPGGYGSPDWRLPRGTFAADN